MEAPLGYSRLNPEVWKEILAHLPMLWRAMCCRVCRAWQEDLEQPQQGHGDDILVDYGVGTLCSMLATKGVDEVMRRIRLHYPFGIPADLGGMDQVRRFVQRHRCARIESVDEWMQLASQEPDAGWLCKGMSKTKLEGMGKSLMRQVVGKPQGFSMLLDSVSPSAILSVVCFSPDGSTIASAGCDGTVCLLDAKTMEDKGTLRGHSERVTSIAYSPDGSAIASSSLDSTVRVWDAKKMKKKGTLKGHVASWQHLDPETKALGAKVKQGESIRSNRTGEYIVTANGDMVYVYRTDADGEKQGEPLACFRSPASVTTVSCKGTSVVVGCQNGQVLFLKAPLLEGR